MNWWRQHEASIRVRNSWGPQIMEVPTFFMGITSRNPDSHVEDVRKIPSWFWQEKGLSSEQGSSLKGQTLFQILTTAGRRESFHLKSPLVFPHHSTEKQSSGVTALGLQIISVMARHECTGQRQKVISSGETLVKVTAPRDKPFKLCDLIRLYNVYSPYTLSPHSSVVTRD